MPGKFLAVVLAASLAFTPAVQAQRVQVVPTPAETGTGMALSPGEQAPPMLQPQSEGFMPLLQGVLSDQIRIQDMDPSLLAQHLQAQLLNFSDPASVARLAEVLQQHPILSAQSDPRATQEQAAVPGRAATVKDDFLTASVLARAMTDDAFRAQIRDHLMRAPGGQAAADALDAWAQTHKTPGLVARLTEAREVARGNLLRYDGDTARPGETAGQAPVVDAVADRSRAALTGSARVAALEEAGLPVLFREAEQHALLKADGRGASLPRTPQAETPGLVQTVAAQTVALAKGVVETARAAASSAVQAVKARRAGSARQQTPADWVKAADTQMDRLIRDFAAAGDADRPAIRDRILELARSKVPIPGLEFKVRRGFSNKEVLRLLATRKFKLEEFGAEHAGRIKSQGARARGHLKGVGSGLMHVLETSPEFNTLAGLRGLLNPKAEPELILRAPGATFRLYQLDKDLDDFAVVVTDAEDGLLNIFTVRAGPQDADGESLVAAMEESLVTRGGAKVYESGHSKDTLYMELAPNLFLQYRRAGSTLDVSFERKDRLDRSFSPAADPAETLGRWRRENAVELVRVNPIGMVPEQHQTPFQRLVNSIFNRTFKDYRRFPFGFRQALRDQAEAKVRGTADNGVIAILREFYPYLRRLYLAGQIDAAQMDGLLRGALLHDIGKVNSARLKAQLPQGFWVNDHGETSSSENPTLPLGVAAPLLAYGDGSVFVKLAFQRSGVEDLGIGPNGELLSGGKPVHQGLSEVHVRQVPRSEATTFIVEGQAIALQDSTNSYYQLFLPDQSDEVIASIPVGALGFLPEEAKDQKYLNPGEPLEALVLVNRYKSYMDFVNLVLARWSPALDEKEVEQFKRRIDKLMDQAELTGVPFDVLLKFVEAKFGPGTGLRRDPKETEGRAKVFDAIRDWAAAVEKERGLKDEARFFVDAELIASVAQEIGEKFGPELAQAVSAGLSRIKNREYSKELLADKYTGLSTALKGTQALKELPKLIANHAQEAAGRRKAAGLPGFDPVKVGLALEEMRSLAQATEESEQRFNTARGLLEAIQGDAGAEIREALQRHLHRDVARYLLDLTAIYPGAAPEALLARLKQLRNGRIPRFDAEAQARETDRILDGPSTPGGQSRFVVLVAPPGAGKSFLAEKARSRGFLVIRPDDYRRRYSGNSGDQSQNAQVWASVRLELVEALKKGRSVVLDATNLDPASRAEWTLLVRQLTARGAIHKPYSLEAVYLDVPWEQAKRNTVARAVRDASGAFDGPIVPLSVFERMKAGFVEPKDGEVNLSELGEAPAYVTPEGKLDPEQREAWMQYVRGAAAKADRFDRVHRVTHPAYTSSSRLELEIGHDGAYLRLDGVDELSPSIQLGGKTLPREKALLIPVLNFVELALETGRPVAEVQATVAEAAKGWIFGLEPREQRDYRLLERGGEILAFERINVAGLPELFERLEGRLGGAKLARPMTYIPLFASQGWRAGLLGSRAEANEAVRAAAPIEDLAGKTVIWTASIKVEEIIQRLKAVSEETNPRAPGKVKIKPIEDPTLWSQLDQALSWPGLQAAERLALQEVLKNQIAHLRKAFLGQSKNVAVQNLKNLSRVSVSVLKDGLELSEIGQLLKALVEEQLKVLGNTTEKTRRKLVKDSNQAKLQEFDAGITATRRALAPLLAVTGVSASLMLDSQRGFFQTTPDGIQYRLLDERVGEPLREVRTLTFNAEHMFYPEVEAEKWSLESLLDPAKHPEELLHLQRLPRIMDRLAQANPEVALIQEAGPVQHIQAMLANHGLLQRYPNIVYYPPKDGRQGLLILATDRVRIDPGRLRMVIEGTRPAFGSAILDLGGGRELQAIDVHTKAMNPDKMEESRRQQAEELQRMPGLWGNGNPSLPVLAVGDFNSTDPIEIPGLQEAVSGPTHVAGALDRSFVFGVRLEDDEILGGPPPNPEDPSRTSDHLARRFILRFPGP